MYFDEQLKIKIVMLTSYIYIIRSIQYWAVSSITFFIDSIDLEDSEYSQPNS